jgi:hypothetical protein
VVVVGVWLRFSLTTACASLATAAIAASIGNPLGARAVEAAGERDRRLVADLEPHPDDGRDSVLD